MSDAEKDAGTDWTGTKGVQRAWGASPLLTSVALGRAQSVATNYQRQMKRMAAVLLDVRGYIGAGDPNLTARIDEALDGFLTDDTRPIPPEGERGR